MKVSTLQENLNKSLNIVSRAVSTKSNLEILGYILLKTENGMIKVSSTNLEIGVSSYVGGKVDKTGEIAVPARLFVDLISSVPNKKIEIDVENGVVNIKSENFKSNIKGLPAEEFPLIPQPKGKVNFKLKKSSLKEAVLSVVFSAAPDESRPVLSGVYLNIKDNNLFFAATDSYRLAEKKIKLDGKNADTEIIIPARSLIELSRVLEGEGDVEVSIDENQALFKTDDVEFTTRLIEGKYPDYKKIIPESSEIKIKIKKGELLNAVKMASLFSRETTNSIRFLLKQKGVLEISSPESQIGGSISELNVETEGKGGEVFFNSKYVLDILNNMKEEDLIFEMSDKVSACVFRNEKDNDYIYIVMPLRT